MILFLNGVAFMKRESKLYTITHARHLMPYTKKIGDGSVARTQGNQIHRLGTVKSVGNP